MHALPVQLDEGERDRRRSPTDGHRIDWQRFSSPKFAASPADQGECGIFSAGSLTRQYLKLISF